MKTHRPLIIGAGLVVITLLVLLFTQAAPGPIPTRTATPAQLVTPFIVVTSEGGTPVALLPTLTPTPQPTPVPTKPRPGYTPVPDNVISPVVIDQSPLPGEEADPAGSTSWSSIAPWITRRSNPPSRFIQR